MPSDRSTRRALDQRAVDHLHRLMANWQLLADLSFADLLLFVPQASSFQVVGQLRPLTARTLHPDDLIGEVVDAAWHPWVERAWRERRRCDSREAVLVDAEPVHIQAIPVRENGDVIAVLVVEAGEFTQRPAGRLESAYIRGARALLCMVKDGTFPFSQDRVDRTTPLGTLRVGDGLVVLDDTGRVDFASPNAMSAVRRLGTTSLPPGSALPKRIQRLAADAMAGARPTEGQVEGGGAVVDIHVIPLLRGSACAGALMLCRDVTELRRLDRALSRREATIREVHHRVKNNLQTVASLLRLQARRLGDEPRAVAALEDSMRRIAAIALVHETLSEQLEGSINLGEVTRRVVGMLEQTLGNDQQRIQIRVEPVEVKAGIATPIAVVLNELVHNAVQHGLAGAPGTVEVILRGTDNEVELEVRDRRAGGSPSLEHSEFAPNEFGGGLGAPLGGEEPGRNGLGLRLVRGLVEEELGGQFSLEGTPHEGSVARVVLPRL